MSKANEDVTKTIVHYQECLEKYARREDESKMLYCIGKLWKLPVTIDHLTETGVGRTVNSLRKTGGEVGERAKSLVAKWKEMVAKEEENEQNEDDLQPDLIIDMGENQMEEDDIEDEDAYTIDESKWQTTSMPDQSEQKSRHEDKESSIKKSSRDKDEDTRYNKKHKDTHRNKDRDSNKYKSKKDSDLADNRENKDKDKSSKRKLESDNKDRHSNSSKKTHSHDYDVEAHKDESVKPSKSSKKDHRHESDSSNYKNDKERHTKTKKTHKHHSDSDDNKSKSVRQKHAGDDKRSSKRTHSESENNHRHQSKTNKKHKSNKHKYDSDHDSEENEEENEDDELSDDDSSDELKVEEETVRHSNKSHNSSKEDKNRDKNKHKDKKDHHRHDSKSSSSNKDKDKTKHSSKDNTKESTKSKHSSSSSGNSKDQASKKRSTHSSKSKVAHPMEDGIGSGSGTSFAEALGMLVPNSNKGNKKRSTGMVSMQDDKDSSGISSPEQSSSELSLLTNKKLEPLNINISSLLPEITPNYKPLGYSVMDTGSNRNKVNTEEETLSALMYNKISRTKVYSGNKVAWGRVPSLFELCTRVLQDNIDALEFTGGVPYSILKPVLERANYNQLFMLEQYNPYLMEDTDDLWKLHCQRDFRNRSREEMETWRDMYQRCLEEREIKLRALTANIKHSQDKSIPVRQTKLAYVDSVVKPPRNIARKQAKHGTAAIVVPAKKSATPSAKLVNLATAGAAADVVVPNPGSRAANTSGGSSNVVIKPKKAPLMQKTLALMKNRFRR